MKSKLVLTICVLLLTILAGTWLAGSILTAPATQPIGDLPADLSGKAVRFQSDSGTAIHGWLIPATENAGTIILVHGVRANRLSMLDRARFLSHAGYSVLLFDCQAHGESEGNHITFGYLESKDVQAAVRFVRDNVPGEKVGLIGVSMGGAAALLAAPPLDVDAIVLEMVYPTIDEAVGNRLSMRLGSWAASLSPLLTWQFRLRLGVDSGALRPIDHVGQLSAPKLFIAGSEDRHTTLEESRRLYETASAPKELWVVEGAAHVDFHETAKAEYEPRVLSFFQTTLRATPKP